MGKYEKNHDDCNNTKVLTFVEMTSIKHWC